MAKGLPGGKADPGNGPVPVLYRQQWDWPPLAPKDLALAAIRPGRQ